MENGKKIGLLALAAALSGAPALALADACTLPGVVVATDPTGDATDSPTSSASTPTVINAEDITAIAVAEPSNLSNRLAVTLKVADLSMVPPQERWVVYFTAPDQTEYYVAMSTANATQMNEATPTFEYGKTQYLATPAATVGEFAPIGALDPASTFNADGTITMIVDPTQVGLAPGALMDNIYSKVRRSSPAETNNIGLTNDDTLSNPGSYTLAGNSSCSKNKSGVLGLGAMPLPGLLMLAGVAALRRRAR